jgi:2-polyprenyl-6-methoxyphenol hydroxylase-like FAD-dependent oxidoreductase
LGLRQQGHEVTLFERSQLAQETGAAIHLAPNCHSILRRFGVFPETFGANPVNGVSLSIGITYPPSDGKVRLM